VSGVLEHRALLVGLLAALVVLFAAGGFVLGRSSRTSQAEATAARKQAMARAYAVAFKGAYAAGKASGFEAGLTAGAATARVQGARAGLLRAAEQEDRRASGLRRRSARAR
jgi:hypothetical protein